MENNENSKLNPNQKDGIYNKAADDDIESVPLYKKKRLIIPLLILIIAAMVIAYYWYMNLQNFVSTDDAYIDANSVSISAKMLGRIDSLGADEGDTVKSGENLVILDKSDLQAEEAAGKSNLELAQKSIPLAQVNISRAQDDFNRALVQYKGGITTKEQYDHAQKTLEAAQAELNIELAKISAAKSQIGVIESKLNNTLISSPMDGIVAKRWVLTGDVVQAGQPIFTIYDLKNIWVTANLEETKLNHIHLGDPVDITVDSYSNTHFNGKVFEIGNYTASEFSLIPPNNASGNFTKVTQRIPVKISITDPSSNTGKKFVLRPGMSVEVSVKVK